MSYTGNLDQNNRVFPPPLYSALIGSFLTFNP